MSSFLSILSKAIYPSGCTGPDHHNHQPPLYKAVVVVVVVVPGILSNQTKNR
jgi:hypothetical protein